MANLKTLLVFLACTCAGASAAAAEWHGLLDARLLARSAGERSWVDEGLGKLRTDGDSRRFYVGQAILRGEGELTDTVTGVAVLSADGDRTSIVDLTEAWVRWNPVPDGPWRVRMRAGAFFPALSLENEGLGWTPTRMISTSAVNTWIGEELRIKGIEMNLARPGRMAGSEHDFGMTATLFAGNDPAGTLLAWRGWSIGDRITGLLEPVRLPDLPVYRSTGPIWRQTRDMRVFRELDDRVGYMVATNYGYGGWLDVAAAHYDNRADPAVVEAGQYGWTTRFNHLSARLRPGRTWDISLQAMEGSTVMGRSRAVDADFRAWYALVSHPLASGELALRYDHFRIRDRDALAGDDNSEDGRGWALAYDYPLTDSTRLLAEALQVDSVHPARQYWGQAARQRSRSLTFALRWQF